MIGFLRKDFYALSSMYRKNLLLVFGLYAVMAIAMEITFLLYFVVWLMSFYSLSVVSIDEASGWDRYARTLPASTAQVVGARFLTALAMTGLGVAFTLLVGAAASLYRGESMEDLAFTLPTVTGLSLASVGLMFPAAYKWGVERARNSFLVVFALVCAGVYLLRNTPAAQGLLRRLETLEELGWLFPCLILAAGIALFLLGCLLSCAIYRKKEF